MEISRRGFFGLMLGALAAEAIPFNRVWSFPAEIVVPSVIPVTQGNQLLTIGMITQETLRVLENNLRFDTYFNSNFDRPFKIGTTISIRKPMRYVL